MRLKQVVLFLSIIINTSSFAQAYSGSANYITLSYGFYSQNLSSFQSYVQSDEFTKGFYKIYNQDLKYYGAYSFKAEFNVLEQFGFGPYIGYEQINYTVLDSGTTAKYKVDFVSKMLSLAVRTNYHFRVKSEILDPFMGFGLGFNMNIFNRVISEEIYPNAVNHNPLPTAYADNNLYLPRPTFLSFTAGTRIYFHPQLALVIEGGWEKTALLHLGLVYKTRRTQYKK